MTYPKLQQDITKLKDAFPEWPDFQRNMVDLEARLQKAIEQEQLSDHPVIQEMVKGFQGYIDYVNSMLQTARSTELPDKDRDRLLDAKDMYEKMIGIFKPPSKEIENLTQTVEETKRQNSIQ